MDFTEPNRELDILVAEAMGARWKNVTPAGRKKELSFPGNPPMAVSEYRCLRLYGGPEKKDQLLPFYTSDSTAAHKALDQMQGHVAIDRIDGEWSCNIDGPECGRCERADTEAMAICSAIILARYHLLSICKEKP